MMRRPAAVRKMNNYNKIKIGNDLLMVMEVGSGWTIADVFWGEGRCAEEIDKLVVIFERIKDDED